MARLGVAEYIRAEREAVSRVPIEVTRSFRPVTFQEVGITTDIQSERDLAGLIDVQHETRFERDYDDYLRGLTKEEFELFMKINEAVVRYSEDHFSQSQVVRCPILRAIHLLRHFNYVTQGKKGLRVFETGPGSGYVTSLLHMSGHRVAATDVTQCFYLYQNNFWDYLSNGGVRELVLKDDSFQEAVDSGKHPIVHIPWWKLATLRPPNLPKFDIITANHCLGEMHPHSLRCYARLYREFLRDGDQDIRAVIFEGWGAPTKGHVHEISEVFYNAGFRLVFYDGAFVIFVPDDSPDAKGSEKLGIPFLKTEQKLLYQDNQVVVDTKQFMSYNVGETSIPGHRLVERVLRGRQQTDSLPKVAREELNQALRKLLGRDNIISPNDEFCQFIGMARYIG